MIPRKRLDISWSGIGLALLGCFRRQPPHVGQALVQKALHSDDKFTLATMSVRSGFDMLLRLLQLPPGSEVITSAITIPDMVKILLHHKLVPVPIDIDIDTCAVQVEQLKDAIGPRTKMILIAHLFGTRMPMDEIAAVAQAHQLTLVEDCAQAYAADGYTGHPDSDVSLFSFGFIKTATAISGALLYFKSQQMRDSLQTMQSNYPVQPNRTYRKKIYKCFLIQLCGLSLINAGFYYVSRLFGTTHDRVLDRWARGFPGGQLIAKLRMQPGYPLLHYLAYRLTHYKRTGLDKRIENACTLCSLLPPHLLVGNGASFHVHWLFPVLSDDPEKLVQALWSAGFDATRGGTSLYAVEGGATAPRARNAQRIMSHVVYLPFEGRMNLKKLADTIKRIEPAGAPDAS